MPTPQWFTSHEAPRHRPKEPAVNSITHIGLDVGSTSVRAVEATRTKDRPVISNFGQVLLPAGAMVSGVVKDDKAVTSAVRQLWSSQDFKSKNVILGVSHQQVV